MAKQEGIHQLRGKVGQMKYYGMKGVAQGLVQSINQGMSDRVKNGAEYANTRLNNAEFGGAGSTAGAITRALSQKWRYLLVPFATGKLAKDVRSIMMLDGTGKWGQRGLVGTSWQAVLAEKVSQYSKNSVGDYRGLSLSCEFDTTAGLKTIYSVADIHNEIAEAAGATGVRIAILSGKVAASAFNADSATYTPATSDMSFIGGNDFDFGVTDDDALSNPQVKAASQTDNTLYASVVVLLPYKEVNGQKYIMQEHCSFKMIAA